MIGKIKSESSIVIVLTVSINYFSHVPLATTELLNILLWNFPPWNTSIFSEHSVNYYAKNKNCTFQNCFITSSRSYLSNAISYDVIVFNSMYVRDIPRPELRSRDQLYVFFSDEPPSMYPVPDYYNGYFNLTWTYKLNSDATFKYIVVKNKEGKVVGPKHDMEWVNHFEMKPTSKHIIKKLQNKKIAAAWFVTHCRTMGKREAFINSLITELDVFDLKIDIFGVCDYGNLTCAQYDEGCHALIESDYYFYIAFENSLCEDYVTEKVLTATKHYAVPIVYGGADYYRFLPDGSYIDAVALGPKNLAKLMNKAIHDKNTYYNFFRWHGYYSFHAPAESIETDEVCAFCALINKKKLFQDLSVHENITGFWNTDTNEQMLALIANRSNLTSMNAIDQS